LASPSIMGCISWVKSATKQGQINTIPRWIQRPDVQMKYETAQTYSTLDPLNADFLDGVQAVLSVYHSANMWCRVSPYCCLPSLYW
jgi:hypothetical protein